MMIRVDFNSDEALYIQLCNQIILGIASSDIQEGETLPSVREMADTIGINMHTVNKAYAILKQEGFLKLDRRKGAVISVDVSKINAKMELYDVLSVALARAMCKNISLEEMHEAVDEVYQNILTGINNKE